MFPSLDISTSALVAQRVRMNAISGNLANLSTTHNEAGEASPYQKRHVVFETDESVGARGAAGVRVASILIDEAPPRLKWDPGHPDAIQEGPNAGYVAYPAIDMMTEFTDALAVARAYEANLGAMEIAKDLAQQTLRILV
jgi:flagellar basal-body rod protein FlgC